jgi:N-carbamoyl-L-amino-acid hydrolase
MEDFAVSLFDRLREDSYDGVGITRESYAAGESAAHDLIARTARHEGLAVEEDAAKNLIVSLPGREPHRPFVACGSHLDSVPRGGNFDGAAGVVAGLTVLVDLKRGGVIPPRTVKTLVLRAEESAWFGRSWLGSSAMFGLLSRNDLELRRATNLQSLGKAMAATGVNVDVIARGRQLQKPRKFAAFIELHIEQGSRLVEQRLPIAIVTAIYGNIRHLRIVCRGYPGHAGSVPRQQRRDSVMAVAELMARLERAWKAVDRSGSRLFMTCGMIGTNPDDHAISRIAGEAWFSIEFRTANAGLLERFHARFKAECHYVAERRNVRFDIDPPIENPPVDMDGSWTRHLLKLCRALDLPCDSFPSGAGHDAAVFANVGIPTAMIFVRNRNGSHNPRETMAIADFMVGSRLLREALLNPLPAR